MNFNFTASISSSPEDNNTEIAKTLIQFKDCSIFPTPSSEGGFWNCNRCPNDDDYCQPYVVGDNIYFQLPYQSGIDNYCELPQFFIVANGVSIEVAYPTNGTNGVEWQYGVGSDGVDYINVVIDTSNAFFVGKQCWYLQIQLLYCPEEVNHQFNSEFYCEVRCEEPTILITGLYPNGYDCNGTYYGSLTNPSASSVSSFLLSFRVRGSVESIGFEFEETMNNNIKVKSKQRELFTLFTHKIPYYVVRQMAAAFNSKELTIDGTRYYGSLKLNKNFDDGNMWIIKEGLYIPCDEINFTCDL
jgi:hypothetical protein